MSETPVLDQDSRYNYSIMVLQGEGYMPRRERDFLMKAIKSYQAELDKLLDDKEKK